MKYIKQPNQSTIQVTFEMTVEELKLLTEGIGNTSELSREKAGMTRKEAQTCGNLYGPLSDACKYYGVIINE